MSDASIICTDVSFAWPDDTPVFRELTFAVGSGRCGLVGANGSGKSTLLRLIAGELDRTDGSIVATGGVGYLPQSLPMRLDATVAEALEIEPVRAALRAIEQGDASEEHFATIGNDWDIEERTAGVLTRLGLADVTLDRPLGTLSGGQVVSIGLAAQLLKQPDVLLLDEPTNNLDLDARERLYRVVDEWNGCLLVVSHDRALLERMDRIAELRASTTQGNSEIRLFGGNFTDYAETIEREQDAARRAARGAELELRRQKRDAQQARERAQRRASTAKRNRDSAGIPKILAGARERRAQESAGRSADVHQQRIADAKSKLDDMSRAVRDDELIAIDLPETQVPAGQTVLTCTNVNVSYNGVPVFANDGVDLSVRGPERVALLGANGSGKSTLLKLINGELRVDSGSVTGSAGRVAYLSQRLDLLDPDRTVLENLRRAAPALSETQQRYRLAQFLFSGDRIHLRTGDLSGGERLRATLACVLFAEPAPKLLLLDEPTNNLDLVSTEQLESALNAFEGAFIVVSHDQAFLTAIGVDRWLRLDGGALGETSSHGQPHR